MAMTKVSPDETNRGLDRISGTLTATVPGTISVNSRFLSGRINSSQTGADFDYCLNRLTAVPAKQQRF
jgi:hypothetical protein